MPLAPWIPCSLTLPLLTTHLPLPAGGGVLMAGVAAAALAAAGGCWSAPEAVAGALTGACESSRWSRVSVWDPADTENWVCLCQRPRKRERGGEAQQLLLCTPPRAAAPSPTC